MHLRTYLRGAVAAAAALLVAAGPACAQTQGYRRLPVSEFRDKMKAGWIGQIAGVSWGAPTEFKWVDKIIPAADFPKWTPRMINDAFGQDDLYVEMTFLRTMEQYGLGCGIRQAGVDFANSKYALWCANNAGRTNLRNGIAPPDSGHPKFSKCPNDIDYQIEADYSGLIAPGMPQWSINLGEKFGRLMNYGDGMYAGQFIGALYAEAFFDTDIPRIIEKALKAIPAECQYAEMVRDMLAWHRENPTDWEAAWQKALAKYRRDPQYQRASNGPIDCKINGAVVLLGLLYGDRDMDKTIEIACRGGFDSDCNPSSAGGVLFTTIGFSKLPERFSSELNEEAEFSYTAYNFPKLIAVCEKLARQALAKSGGKVIRDASGEEVFLIPIREPKPSALELSWDPGPAADVRFTPAEMKRIRVDDLSTEVKKAAQIVAPGWKVTKCGPDMAPGLQPEWAGKKNVLLTHPLDRDTACRLTRTIAVPKRKAISLNLTVGHHPGGDWALDVLVDGKNVLTKTISKDTCVEGWTDVTVDLTPYAGSKVTVELLNRPTEWFCEAGYWAKIEVASK